MTIQWIGDSRRLTRSITQMKPNAQFQDYRLCAIVKFSECDIPIVAIWNSEVIDYRFVFEPAGQRCVLYNGNGYGKTGFALAVLEQS